MKINYFNCEFHSCDSTPDDDGNSEWIYYCEHPKGNNYCSLDNKYDKDEADCILLDQKGINGNRNG